MLLLEQHGLLTRAAAQLPAFCDMVLLLKVHKSPVFCLRFNTQVAGFQDAFYTMMQAMHLNHAVAGMGASARAGGRA